MITESRHLLFEYLFPVNKEATSKVIQDFLLWALQAMLLVLKRKLRKTENFVML